MAENPFNLNFDPVIGEAAEIAPGLRRIVAPNASAMTFRGTNSYLLGTDSLAVIDPGPDDPQHLEAIMNAAGKAPISHIMITHSHVDHSPLAARLAKETGAPIFAFGDSLTGQSPRMAKLAQAGELGGGEGVDRNFSPDIRLKDDEVVAGKDWSLRAIHTPGHFSNHLCFAWEETGAVFSGDHVMGWATTLVSPPDGDLGAFMVSLDKMAKRKADQRYFPGHGDVLNDPHHMINHLKKHRKMREGQIVRELATEPRTPFQIAGIIYTDVDPRLIPAAARNVFSHLIDLTERKVVSHTGPLSAGSMFHLIKGV